MAGLLENTGYRISKLRISELTQPNPGRASRLTPWSLPRSPSWRFEPSLSPPGPCYLTYMYTLRTLFGRTQRSSVGAYYDEQTHRMARERRNRFATMRQQEVCDRGVVAGTCVGLRKARYTSRRGRTDGTEDEKKVLAHLPACQSLHAHGVLISIIIRSPE